MVASNPPARITRFVEEYSLDQNGTAAAIRAGYAPKSAHVAASRLIRNHKVQEALAARQRALAERFQIDREGIVAELLAAANLARRNADPAGMVAAYREIGRLCGFYPPMTHVVDATPSMVELARLEAMSDEELMKLAGGSGAY